MRKEQLRNLSRQVDVLNRQRFLDAYSEFEAWLKSIGFRSAHCFGEDSTTDNNIFIHKIDSLYGVEHYINEIVDMQLYFTRERNNHVFYFLWDFNYHSLPHTLDEFKSQILKDVKNKKDIMLAGLNSLLIIS